MLTPNQNSCKISFHNFLVQLHLLLYLAVFGVTSNQTYYDSHFTCHFSNQVLYHYDKGRQQKKAYQRPHLLLLMWSQKTVLLMMFVTIETSGHKCSNRKNRASRLQILRPSMQSLKFLQPELQLQLRSQMWLQGRFLVTKMVTANTHKSVANEENRK